MMKSKQVVMKIFNLSLSKHCEGILDRQILAAKIKKTLYTTVASAFALITVTDIIAATKEDIIDTAEITQTSLICSKAAAMMVIFLRLH